MDKQHTIVLVLKRGGDFTIEDVNILSSHIHLKWKSPIKPRIIVLVDRMDQIYKLGDYEIHPLTNNYYGTWARMQLYSPEMEQYRPFLYIDLDTAVIQSVENIFNLVKDTTKFITLEDFWQKRQLATALVWIPANSEKIKSIWKNWCLREKNFMGARMDNYLRRIVVPDLYWQKLTDTIYDFKGPKKKYLETLPENVNLVCFHGKPRIRESNINWVKNYISMYLDNEWKKLEVEEKIKPFNQSIIKSIEL